MRVLDGACLAAVMVAVAGVVGCGGAAAPPPGGSAPPTPATGSAGPSALAGATALAGARAQLAGLAAAAKDRRMVAGYTLRGSDRPDRTVTVTLATDGTWRIDIPGGALGGAADIAVAATGAGLYQCALPTTARSGGCVLVAGPDGSLPAAIDPRVWRAFTDWPAVLTDRRAPLSVTAAAPPAGTGGSCYSVEPTSASLAAPVDPGIYCYAPDGTLTAAVVGFGTLVLASAPGPAPPTVSLPAPVVAAAPLPTAAPPAPSISATHP